MAMETLQPRPCLGQRRVVLSAMPGEPEPVDRQAARLHLRDLEHRLTGRCSRV
jgi:hypothetical protein